MNRTLAFLSTLAIIATPVAAHAHFLWAVADPATNTFSVEFAESPGDSVIPKLAGKGDAVRGWTRKGSPTALTVDGDRLRGKLSDGAAGVALDYGVLDRTQEGRGKFWLHYYAKAASTPSASQIQIGLPVELSIAKGSQGQLVLTVRQNAKPAPGAEVVAHFKGEEKPFEGKTDEQGNLTLPAATDGPIAIRALVTTTKSGKVGDAAYDLIRDYGTLTIQSGQPPKAATGASAALESVFNAREQLPSDIFSIEGKISAYEIRLEGLRVERKGK